MPRGREFDESEKKFILQLHHEGRSNKCISKIVNRNPRAINYIIKHIQKRKSIENLPRSGRPKVLSKDVEKEIINKIRENPQLSAPEINKELRTHLNINISDETVRKVLRKHDWQRRITNQAKSKVPEPKTYHNKDITYWKNVVFGEFNIFGLNGRRMTGLKEAEADNVMVWCCMSAHGVGHLRFYDEIRDHQLYSEILAGRSDASLTKLGLHHSVFHIQRHEADKHNVWDAKNLNKLDKNPDFNPLENLLLYLEYQLRKHPIECKISLQMALLDEWNKITPEMCTKMVESYLEAAIGC
ncbi:Transposable element Tcb2 transposase [Lucilia cuprina]|nr:Transposable element Tcb2 transposase [Lucilia cuprina]